MVKLSVTSKLDGIKSWSLQALTTCPGSKDSEGNLVPACAGCYATTGNYNYPNVKKPRLENQELWQKDTWVSDMVQALQNERYFRWFDSGDMYHIKLAEKILEVMTLTPWCSHWLPTRMHKFAKFRQVIDKMQALENVVVRFSSDSVTGESVEGLHSSVIFSGSDQITGKGFKVCEAYQNEGKCNGCRACWTKSVGVIAYPAHGKKMQKVIRILAA